MYATDHDDRLPPAKSWTDSLTPYTKRNPADFTKRPQFDDVGLGMNRYAAAALLTDVWDVAATVMLAQLRGQGVNQLVDEATARPESFRSVAFMDGHAKFVSTTGENELIWKPFESPHDEVDDQPPDPAPDQQ